MEIRRKLYTRGSSYETTIPKPLLFPLNLEKKHDVVFSYDPERKAWYIRFEESQNSEKKKEKKEAERKKARRGEG